jgi:hypothetical protein
MRRSNWTPSIVPGGYDQTVYFVAADFGRVGQAWREADYRGADLESIIQHLLGLKTMKEVYLYLLSAALVILGLVLAIMSWRERRRDVLYGRYIDPNEAKDERET